MAFNFYEMDPYIRPKLDDRINKNQMTKQCCQKVWLMNPPKIPIKKKFSIKFPALKITFQGLQMRVFFRKIRALKLRILGQLVFELYYTSCNTEQIIHQLIIRFYGQIRSFYFLFIQSFSRIFGHMVFYFFGPPDSV